MNVHKRLIWSLLYSSIIHLKNVVYCTVSGIDQSQTISSDFSGTSPLHQPSSTTTSLNGETTTPPISGSTDPSSDGLATSTGPVQSSSKVLTGQSQSISTQFITSVDLMGMKLFTIDNNGHKVDLDETLYQAKFLFKGRNILVINLNRDAKCASIAVEDKVIWSRDNSETPININSEKEYPNKIFYTIQSPEFENSHNHLISCISAKLIFVVFKDKHLRYMLLYNKWVLKMNQDVPVDEFKEFLQEANLRVNAITKTVPQKAPEVPAEPNEPKTQAAKTDSQSLGSSSSQQSSGYSLSVDTTSHDDSKYDHETKNNDVTFTFKKNVKCTEVKCNNVKVWSKGDQNISEPKSVVYNSNENRITIGDYKSSVMYNKKSDGTWYHFTTVNIESDVTSAGEDTTTKQTESSFQPDKGSTSVVTTPQQTSTFPDTSSSQPGDASSTEASEDSQLESGSTHTSGTNQVLLTSLYPTGAASTYAWDADNYCSSGSSSDPDDADGGSKSSDEPSEPGSEPVEPDQQPSSQPVESSTTQTQQKHGGSKSALTDQSALQKTPVSEGANEGTGSGSAPPGQSQTSAPTSTATADTSNPLKLTGVELSLKKSNGTNEFSYNKAGNVATFTAKSGFGFSSVKTKTSCCGSSCCGSDVTIWDSKDPKEYASKVVLEGKGQKSNKVVTIHLANESKKVFKKISDNSWETDVENLEKSGSDSTNECHLKIYTKDPNDPSNTIVLDHSKIKPVGDKGDNKLYKFEFGDEVECTEVKYSDESLWKHGTHGSKEHPKLIFYHELVKIVFVEVPKDTFQFYRKKISNRQWAHEQLKSTDKVDKDKVKLCTDISGKNELASDKYSVKQFPFGFEFALKEGSNCQQLKYESKTFTFKSDGSGKYPVNICFLNNKHCVVVYKSQAYYKTPD